MTEKELEPIDPEGRLQLKHYSLYKYQLAALYDVDIKTMVAWMDLFMDELLQLGYHKKMKKLPPKIVRHIIDHWGGA